jgi:hypothetical protein
VITIDNNGCQFINTSGHMHRTGATMNPSMQGHRIELVYMQYLNDLLTPLPQVLAAVDNYMPTDVLLNFGVLMRFAPRNTNCGLQNAKNQNHGRCPYMPDLCHFLRSSQHDYKVLWQTTTPSLEDMQTGVFNRSMDVGHNLNPVSACRLGKADVLDTNEMLQLLHSVPEEMASLYFNRHSVVVDAHHAFNWNFVRSLRSRLGNRRLKQVQGVRGKFTSELR